MQPASSSLEAQWPDLVAAVSAAIDLEATARASGALVRRRAIRSAEMLLRLALAYGPGGLSLRTAAARPPPGWARWPARCCAARRPCRRPRARCRGDGCGSRMAA